MADIKRIVSILIILCVSAFLQTACEIDTDPGNESNYSFEELTGDVNFYFGNFHSHTGNSDGTGTPQAAFTWARDTAGFDFYAVTDHDIMITQNAWDDTGSQADKFNQDGVFAALRGFEWSHLLYGHMVILLTDNYTSMLLNSTMESIYSWIEDNNAIAQFNHPGREAYVFNNLANDADATDNFYGIETGNKSTGNANGGYYKYYIMALDNGWKTAPVAGQDNHTLTANSHRTVYIGKELSRDALISAIKARRIYSSDDPNMRVMFKYGNMWMGSTVSLSAPSAIKFEFAVSDDETVTAIELITNKGAVASKLACAFNTGEVQWNPTVQVTANSYYFIRVTEKNTRDNGDGGAQIAITSPIWFEIP